MRLSRLLPAAVVLSAFAPIGCANSLAKPVSAYSLSVQDEAAAATEEVNRCQNEADPAMKAKSCDRARQRIDAISKSAATLNQSAAAPSAK